MGEKFLTDSVIFLAHRVASISAERFGEELAKEGITLWVWRVLAVLLEDGDRRLGEIAESVRTDMSTVSRTVTTMEGQRLVTRRFRMEEDGRALSINLTAKGRALAQRLLPFFHKHREAYLKDISAEEQEVVRACLNRIYANIVAASPVKSRRKKQPAAKQKRIR